ncbi:MAG: LrgB family protein, partial [Lachnospiraceae bacterium]|nr:LrgB family protein [Lachnospiraceae bacterium]
MREVINDCLSHSTYFAIVMSLAFYLLGIKLKQKYKLAIFSPLIVASVLTIAMIVILGIDMEVY